MHYLFVDESYEKDCYYMGGVLVNQRQLQALQNRLDQLATSIQQRNQWPTSPEFHGHALMNGLEDWQSLSGKYGACISIYQKVLHAIQNSGAHVFIEGVDVNRLNARYKYPESPHELTLRHLLERVNEECALRGEKFHVIADTVPREEDFKRSIQQFTTSKTPGFRSQQLHCIEGDIVFKDSREHRGIQATDMCTYIIRRHKEGIGRSKQSKRATARLVNSLGDALIHQRKWTP